MDSKQSLLPAYVLSGIVVVAAVLGSLVLMETATVNLVVPASRLVANVTLQGGPHGKDLVTTTISADVSDSQQGTASNILVPPTFATGQVVFSCGPCPSGTAPIPEGTTVSTATGFPYATVARAEIVAPQTSVQVGIKAGVSGAHGNTASNTVTVINKVMANFKVTNPQPTTGGADSTTTQVVQQSDLDRTQLALMARVSQDIDSALGAQAGGLAYLPSGEPTIKVISDHKVGDPVAGFTMTMTATQTAIAFSQLQADSILRKALNQKLPKGFTLTAAPIQTSYQAQTPSATGDVTIKGTGTGVIVPNVTAAELKARIRGMQIDAARKQLQLLAPGTSVDISIKPAIPWLPVLQDHINLTIAVESPA